MLHAAQATVLDGAIVVYTAISARYDSLKEVPTSAREGVDRVAFLEEPQPSETWRVLPLHAGFQDPARNAKIHKILPHVYFPNAQYSLWIDGSVTIRFSFSVRRLIELYLAECDLAVFQHRERTCIYQEAGVCLQRRLDDPDVIWRQVCRYTQEGYPPNAGLAECPVVLRRHSAAVQAFNEAWWDEIVHGSKRDQLSFPYVARKVGLRAYTFPGSIRDTPLFERGRHTVDHSQTPQFATQAPSERRVARSAPRGRTSRTIAFGPVRNTPSWNWVGLDTARELSKYYNVVLYDALSPPPDCDVLFIIKRRPADQFVIEAQKKQVQLVYCPVDAHTHHAQLVGDTDLFRACAMVLVHSERLLPLVRPYCDRAHFVEHHARFVTPMTDYRDNGFILWTGACKYVPYLLRWLEHHPIDHEVRILTDIDNDRARQKASMLAAEIRLPFEIARDTTSIMGHRIYRWTERRQDEMMRACKAALDVKMTEHFEQYYKPPTKAQQYIASGIPFAVNPDSYSAEYFRVRGFEVASLVDTTRWLSREYWEATRIEAERLRVATSIEVVGSRYRELIESLCDRPR